MKPLLLPLGALLSIGTLLAESPSAVSSSAGARAPVAPAAASSDPGAPASATASPRLKPTHYQEFITAAIRPENVAECVQVMDRVIDQAEAEEAKGAPVLAKGETSLGLQFEFRRLESKEAVAHRLVFSRGGEPMPFSDAVKFIALFADRAGLLHPVDVREGERPIFYAQWLIKATEWKTIRPKMLALRTANRAEKDLAKAFTVAVTREVDAREAFHSAGRPIK
jgi:hypothetical protein